MPRGDFWAFTSHVINLLVKSHTAAARDNALFGEWLQEKRSHTQCKWRWRGTVFIYLKNEERVGGPLGLNSSFLQHFLIYLLQTWWSAFYVTVTLNLGFLFFTSG